MTLAFSVLFPDMYFLTFLDTVVLFLDTRVSSTPTWREFLEGEFLDSREFLDTAVEFPELENAGWNFEYMCTLETCTTLEIRTVHVYWYM